MSKLLIGGLVGSILLFVWQFLSWSMLNVHGNEFQYSENQAEILTCLEGKLDNGQYFMPRLPDSATGEEKQAYMQESAGKPWMLINYRKEFNANQGLNMFRGWLVNFVSVVLLCWILMKIPESTFLNTLLSSLAVGLIGYMTITYIDSVWFETSSIGGLIDALVGWGLVGAWLGWWLNR